MSIRDDLRGTSLPGRGLAGASSAKSPLWTDLIVAAAIAIGLCIGVVADILIRLRGAKRSTRGAIIEGFAVCAGVHAFLALWAMADSPQLYASRWYATGGVARTVQVFDTDVLGTRGVVLLFSIAVVLSGVVAGASGRAL